MTDVSQPHLPFNSGVMALKLWVGLTSFTRVSLVSFVFSYRLFGGGMDPLVLCPLSHPSMVQRKQERVVQQWFGCTTSAH